MREIKTKRKHMGEFIIVNRNKVFFKKTWFKLKYKEYTLNLRHFSLFLYDVKKSNPFSGCSC
jgi:hypothetical protein